MKNKILLWITLSLLLVSNVSASWNKKPQFHWRQLYRYDIKKDKNQLYSNRLTSIFDYSDKNGKSLFKLSPFFEARRNVHRGLWEREEAGVEIGKDVFPWFYLGEAIQAVWLREDYQNYTRHKKRASTELETRLLFSYNLIKNKNIKLKGFFLNEYTYDFEIGAVTRNEAAAGLVMPLGKFVESDMNWRHIDRIHDYDSDAFELSVTVVF